MHAHPAGFSYAVRTREKRDKDDAEGRSAPDDVNGPRFRDPFVFFLNRSSPALPASSSASFFDAEGPPGPCRAGTASILKASPGTMSGGIP